MLLRPLPADDPGLLVALRQALDGGPPLAPLPPDPTSTLAMLQPDRPVEPDTALVVSTSGSTGHPKGVRLSGPAVRAGADATHQWLGGPGDWVLALPAHHVAGVMVLARAVVARTTVRYADPRLDDLPTPSVRTFLSLVPTQLHRALTHPDLTQRLAGYTAVLLGGAPAPQELLTRARTAGINVVTTYGMSETSGGCVYDGQPLPGVSVQLGERQRISISGPMVFSGYRLRPDLTEATLTNGRVITNDRGRWRDDRFEVLGRLDDVVVSGGVNVDLAEVERELQRHWPQAAAIGVPDETWGHLVVAAGPDLPDLAALRARLTTLEPAARPRAMMRFDVLPATSSGKVDRQQLITRWPDHHDKEQL
ncbi:AMP-binding protein [Naumannella sp. ID2617S]|nr:AMP-binding protein [Naumannella sp. ID2617S]